MLFDHLGATIWHSWTIIYGVLSIDAIDALKDNIREAIGEIQLHTIDDMPKNWTDRVASIDIETSTTFKDASLIVSIIIFITVILNRITA